MRRIRFSLRGLILLVGFASLFLGFSQYRRREILKMCAELKEDYGFTVPNAWHDYVWQRKPTVAIVFEAHDISGSTDFQPELYRNLDAERESQTRIERLKELGVVEYR